MSRAGEEETKKLFCACRRPVPATRGATAASAPLRSTGCHSLVVAGHSMVVAGTAPRLRASAMLSSGSGGSGRAGAFGRPITSAVAGVC